MEFLQWLWDTLTEPCTRKQETRKAQLETSLLNWKLNNRQVQMPDYPHITTAPCSFPSYAPPIARVPRAEPVAFTTPEPLPQTRLYQQGEWRDNCQVKWHSW